MPPSKTKKFRISIDVNEAWCKACNICADFCPEEVLELRGLAITVRDLEACTGCKMCELICPDFAIKVHKERIAAATDGEGGA